MLENWMILAQSPFAVRTYCLYFFMTLAYSHTCSRYDMQSIITNLPAFVMIISVPSSLNRSQSSFPSKITSMPSIAKSSQLPSSLLDRFALQPGSYRTLYFAFSVNWLLLENLKKHLLIKTIKSTDTQFRFGIYWIHIFFNWYFGCVNFQRSTVIAQTWKCTLYIYKFLFIFYCLAQSQNKPFVY